MATSTYSPRQQLFDTLFDTSTEAGFRTFNKLPSSDVDYPFVVIEQTAQSGNRLSKFKRAGTLNATVSVWGTQNDSGSVDLIMWQLDQKITKLNQLDSVFLEINSVQSNVVKLIEGDEELLHGTLDASFTFY